MIPEDFANQAITLFDGYKNSFGMKTLNELNRVVEYEEKFNSLICKYQGHEWAGLAHADHCVRCFEPKLDR